MADKQMTDAQEHWEAMQLRRVAGEPHRQEAMEYVRQSMDIVICCSCGWPVDKWDRQNINIGNHGTGNPGVDNHGVRCLTCVEERRAKTDGRNMVL